MVVVWRAALSVWVLVLIHVVCGQEAFYQNYAYTKVMGECLGERVYQDYLQRVAVARRECNTQTTTHNRPPGSSRLTPFAFNFPQGGTVQQPGVFSQPPGVFSQPPGVFHQQPVFSQPSGVFSQRPGVFSQPPGVFAQQPGVFSRQPGVFSQQPGVFSQPPALQGEGGSPQQVLHPGSFIPSRQGLPFGPRLPNFRQKRALVLGRSEIQDAMKKVLALVGNFTCVLTRLGVVNKELDINFEGLATNVFNQPVAVPLKNDLISAIEYCRDMALCLPLEKQQSAVPHQLQRLKAFIKCEKEERLSACLKHDLRKNVHRVDLSLLPNNGGRTDDLETLFSLLVGAESANELELI
ncbi:uncharacterized protein LOC121854505 [Homarus americanus]|uniref:Uncharacterized protein n=1 Tax=Homarus americanus TaxID=6706 RepID=A0A8J5MLP5_HOMAM|nr:uncharacterized protein LOC121854505 [Homarus americanus]KAG7155812.1 hypothetical protein Hamer_G025424 [Homarus americanus]